MAESSPTVRQKRVGRELRRWRTERDLTQDQVASLLDWNKMRVSRAETRGAGMSDIIAMATVLRVGDTERDRVVAVAQQARDAAGWWTNYADDVVPHYVADLLETEADAQCVRSVETMFIPGLFQTDAYTDALMRAGATSPAVAGDVLEDRRRIRQQRQARLDGAEPLQLHAIIHETALRLPVAPPGAMAEQLDHLVTRASQRNITVQVVPYSLGAYPGIGRAWSLFSYDGRQWAVAFVDHLRAGLYLEDDDLVKLYGETFERLAKVALDPKASVRFIKQTRAALAS